MALIEVCEVREFGMLKQTTPDIPDREKVSHRPASIPTHVDKSTSAPGHVRRESRAASYLAITTPQPAGAVDLRRLSYWPEC